MTRSNSELLKAIGGVLLIEVQGESKLCCLEDMMHSKCFSVGQIFWAVAVLNNKTPESYGDSWPKYRNKDSEVSQDWKVLEAVRNDCSTDFEFVLEVCSQLGEVPPEVLARSEVQKNLDKYRQGTLL